MSLAGRPSQRARLEEALIANAAENFYVCRRVGALSGPRPNARILDCERCGEKVVATPYLLAEKRALAHTHGRTLTVICDECVPANAARNGRPVIALMPTPEESAEAERFNRG